MLPAILISLVIGGTLGAMIASFIHATDTANRSGQYLREFDQMKTEHKLALFKTYTEGREDERKLQGKIGEIIPAIEAWAVGKN